MQLFVLNEQFQAISIIDTYESIIWTDRYYSAGDFEIHAAMKNELLNYLKLKYYLLNRNSEHLMIIDKIVIESEVEDGSTITISGKSAESILNRRIIWGQTFLSGNFQNAIKTIITESMIAPTDPKRSIGNIVFEDTDDTRITDLTIESQYVGENIYDVIQKLCEERDIGFKLILNDQNQFVFKLYMGTDRSYSQTIVPYVIFSPKFDNMIESNYLESNETMKNVALIGGEGEGSLRKFASVGDAEGMDRRELFVNASDISSDVGNHKILTASEYANVLRQKGSEQLASIEYSESKAFEGKIETGIMFQYGVDFFNGDIVQLANEYGHEGRVRIIEVIQSVDESGTSIYPTYKTIT